MLDNIIHYIIIIFGGFILGYLLAIIRFKDILLGPNSKNVYNRIFRHNDKCYRLIPTEKKCSLFDKHI
jgi:hypothetical protein